MFNCTLGTVTVANSYELKKAANCVYLAGEASRSERRNCGPAQAVPYFAGNIYETCNFRYISVNASTGNYHTGPASENFREIATIILPSISCMGCILTKLYRMRA